VYAVGFRCGYPNIEGVGVFRAQEVLKSIGIQQDSSELLPGIQAAEKDATQQQN
jgi:hypothetical protein